MENHSAEAQIINKVIKITNIIFIYLFIRETLVTRN